MLRTSKLKELVSKTHPFMKEMVSPTKAILYAFSDCIIHYNGEAYDLKCKDHLVLEGEEINVSMQLQGIEYGLSRGFVFGFLDDVFFKFEDVEDADLQDKDVLNKSYAKIKKRRPILDAWSSQIDNSYLGVKSLWGIPKK
tara:strand:- start:1367 stop:1786 length:420 start_codon:yes stop_codon:yes gene_type:complete